jgi:hypothetical protein
VRAHSCSEAKMADKEKTSGKLRFGRALLVLGYLGMLVTAILLAFDFLYARTFSFIVLGLLSLSLAVIGFSSLLTGNPRETIAWTLLGLFQTSGMVFGVCAFHVFNVRVLDFNVGRLPLNGRFFAVLVTSICLCTLFHLARISIARKSGHVAP